MCVGPQKANQDLSVCYGESGDISRPNDDVVIGQCDLIVERERAYSLVCGVPKSKPRFHLFTFGRAEVRVAHYPLGTQNKRLLYCGKAEEHVAQ